MTRPPNPLLSVLAEMSDGDLSPSDVLVRLSNGSLSPGTLVSQLQTGSAPPPVFPPALSAPTPSGTLGSSTAVTLGCTTNQTGGTLYAVVDSAANLAGITVAQIKLGLNKNGVAAVGAATAAVLNTTPSASISGLTAATGYSYALVQNNTAGDSNAATGTFTTAAAASGVIFYDNFESKITYPSASPNPYKIPYHADSSWNSPAPGYSGTANGFGQPGNAGIFILPRSQLDAALLADSNFPVGKQQVYEGRITVSEVETWTDLDFSSFGLYDIYFSFWEYRPTGGQKAGEKFFCVTRANGGQIIWGLAPLSTGAPAAAAGHMGVFNNSSGSYDFPEQDFNISVDGSLTHWEFRYLMSTGVNADGIYQVWQNGILVCDAQGIRNNTLAGDRTPWAKMRTTAWSSGTINANGGYPIRRQWCAFKIASSRQGVWAIT